MAAKNNKKENFLKALEANHGNISAACRGANIPRSGYYKWMKNCPDFAQTVDDIQEGLLDFSESKLRQLIEKGNLGAICFHLKCKGKHRGWVERQEMSGPDGGPLGLEHGATKDLIAKLTEALEKSGNGSGS